MAAQLNILGMRLGFGLLILGIPASAAAEEPKIPSDRSPIAAVLEAQNSRQEKTIADLKIALDDDADIRDRTNALAGLGGIEYDYLLANGETLVMAAPEVAQAAISTIGAEIAMLPVYGTHQMNSETGDPLSKYQESIVRRSEEILTIALEHPDPNVRLDAAAILAGRGEAKALVAIDDMIKKGEIEARSGLGYMSLAPNLIASPFLEKYALEGDANVQAVAVSQLAYNPAYTDRIREIALAPNTPGEVTSAALPGLSLTDETFLEYGLALANDPDRSTAAREAALEASLDTLTARHLSSSALDITMGRALRQASEDINTENAFEAYRAFETKILGNDG